ncbi:MAG TPA: hypothetical protein VGF56_12375 [Rhizomicrobium sp.]
MAANAIRLSAVLAIVVGALYAQGLYGVLKADGAHWMWPVFALGVLMPLVPGVMALLGRAVFLLALAWGWVLGVYVPKLLTQLLTPVSPAIDRANLVMVCLALAGLALYLFGVYRRSGT